MNVRARINEFRPKPKQLKWATGESLAAQPPADHRFCRGWCIFTIGLVSTLFFRELTLWYDSLLSLAPPTFYKNRPHLISELSTLSCPSIAFPFFNCSWSRDRHSFEKCVVQNSSLLAFNPPLPPSPKNDYCHCQKLQTIRKHEFLLIITDDQCLCFIFEYI